MSTRDFIEQGQQGASGAKKATRAIKLVKKDKVRWPLHNFTMVRELHKLLEAKEKDNFGLSDAIRNLVKEAKDSDVPSRT